MLFLIGQHNSETYRVIYLKIIVANKNSLKCFSLQQNLCHKIIFQHAIIILNRNRDKVNSVPPSLKKFTVGFFFSKKPILSENMKKN